MKSFWSSRRVTRQPNSLLGRWLAASLANRTELRGQYSARIGEAPQDGEQTQLVQEVFEDLLDHYLGLDGTTEAGLLDETERLLTAPQAPSRSRCEQVIMAARQRTSEVPPEVTFAEILVVEVSLCYVMLPRLAWTESQVIDLICEVERRIGDRGIALHLAEGAARVPAARPSMTRSHDYREAVAAVWEAGTEADVTNVLARCNSYFPMASLLLFRAAIRWKFPVPCDPQEVARFVSGCLARVAEHHRHLFEPRAAEAAILVELNGEASLVPGIPLDQEPARITMQLVTRNVFAEAVVDPRHGEQLRSIAERVADEHREIAKLSDLRLDRLFASRSFDPAEIEAEVARIIG